MKSRWIDHQQAPVFIADFSYYGSDAAGVAAECETVRQALTGMPLRSVRSVTFVEGTLANEDIIHHLIDLLKTTNPYIGKRAVVGVSGYRRHLLYAFSKAVGDVTFSVFDILDEALTWLAT